MPKIVKTILIVLAALIGLLLVAAVILAATFDPNDYKPQIIKLVQEKKQRTLTIPGDIKLSFFPSIGADLGELSLSERNGKEEFVSVDRARVSLALLPLLSKQLVVDSVHVDGLRARVTRNKDGATNYDDLIAPEEKKEPEEAGGEVSLDIDSIEITNAQLVYDDRQQDRRLEVANLNLETGRIANGVPSKFELSADVKSNKPQVAAHVKASSGFTLDFEQGRYVLKGLDAEVGGALAGFTDLILKVAGNADLQPADMRFALEGIQVNAEGQREGQPFELRLDLPQLALTDTKVSGGKLSGNAKLVEKDRSIAASFSAPSFEGTPQAFKLPSLNFDANVKGDALDVTAKLSGAVSGDIDKMLFTSPELALTVSGKQGTTAINGSLTTPMSANLQTQKIDMPKLAADFTLPNPAGGTLVFKAGGNVSADLDKKTVNAALDGKLDQSAIKAKLGLAGFSPSAYTFDIGIDQLDLDRYTGTQPAQPQAISQSKGTEVEKPIDLSALAELNAKGSVRVGALKAANIKTTNLRVDLRAANGKLDINPLTANLYGGSVAGSLSAAHGATPRFAMRQKLSGVQVGPLLKDAVGNDRLMGKGDVQLDVTAHGATFSQMKKGLNGTANLTLRDGAVKGINIAQVIRNGKAKISQLRGDEVPQTGSGSDTEKTDFSEMSGSFRINNGVAHNEDLDVKSPLVRVGGSGDINLVTERLDYLVRATVVSTLKGQGGPELEALKGVTVPVKLTGPFSAVDWRIDFSGIARELAKKKVDEKKEEIRGKAQESIERQKEKLDEKVKERLKGLLGG
jgi:AsmA protein